MVKPIQHASASCKGKGDLPNTNLQYMQEVHLVKPSPDMQVGLAQLESKEQVGDRDVKHQVRWDESSQAKTSQGNKGKRQGCSVKTYQVKSTITVSSWSCQCQWPWFHPRTVSELKGIKICPQGSSMLNRVGKWSWVIRCQCKKEQVKNQLKNHKFKQKIWNSSG